MHPPKPPCLEGYDAIPRKWHNQFESYVANVVPGEFYVTNSGEGIMTTLGSCIAVCVRDRVHGVGGLNHFMLPQSEANDGSGRAGDWAMEFLINGILLNGGERQNLEVKYFGGAQMLSGLKGTGIGNKNIDFIKNYIHKEQLKVVASDVGGATPRKVIFFPKTGQVKLKKLPLKTCTDIQQSEQAYAGKLVTHDQHAGSVDLF